jgi:valyl-tRNA synthetase
VKQLAEADKERQRLTGKLDNQEFVAKAPPEVITEHRERVGARERERGMLASSEQQLRVMLGS